MKRFLYLTAAVILLLCVCACEAQTAVSSPGRTPSSLSGTDDIAEQADEKVYTQSADADSLENNDTLPNPEPTRQEARVTEEPAEDHEDWQSAYIDFLSSNSDKLSELIFGGIAGVGFSDLDLDGIAEMILFDSGASASMGVQFFDIADGEVQCVSANIEDLKNEFGGDYVTKLFVNANMFEDFRLVEDGDKTFFTVKSWNGAQDFLYEEIIIFTGGEETSTGAVLKLESMAYRYDEFDLETGEISSSRYEAAGSDITEEEYNSIMASVQTWEDLDMEVKGRFIWEKTDYASGSSGIMAMAGDAIDDYDSALDFLG